MQYLQALRNLRSCVSVPSRAGESHSSYVEDHRGAITDQSQCSTFYYEGWLLFAELDAAWSVCVRPHQAQFVPSCEGFANYTTRNISQEYVEAALQ